MTRATPTRPEPEVEEAFDRLVEEGEDRLRRPVPQMISTTILGGIDVGTGVLAYLLVQEATKSHLLAGLAFGIGFVALLLARSELFTENFLVPVIALAAGRGSAGGLARLWVLALVGNLAGGWVFMWLVTEARPELHSTEIETGSHYAHLGFSMQSLTLAILAGAVITLMTRMQHGTDSVGVRIVPALLFGFLLAGGQLFHSVLDSLFMFGALQTGHADFGYLDWFGAMCWAILGNLIGGLLLVTAIRLLRVPHRLMEERRRNTDREDQTTQGH